MNTAYITKLKNQVKKLEDRIKLLEELRILTARRDAKLLRSLVKKGELINEPS